MKIPQYFSQQPIIPAPPDPKIASMVSNAQAELGSRAAGVANDFLNSSLKVMEEKKKVDNALAGQGGVNQYRSAMDKFFADPEKKPGTEPYMQLLRDFSEQQQKSVLDTIKDPETNARTKLNLEALDLLYGHKARVLDNRAFIETRQGEALTQINDIVQMAANAKNDEDRALVADEGGKFIDSLSGLFGSKKVDEMKAAFSGLIQKQTADAADAAADQAIKDNPLLAYTNLKDPNYLPALFGQAREDKRKDAERSIPVWQAYQNLKMQEATKKAHDDEEQNIGNLCVQGDYPKAHAAVLLSNSLTGEEKVKWENAIRDALQKNGAVSPYEEAKAWSYHQGLINQPVIDKNAVRNGIVLDSDLSMASKKELLGHLDKNEDLETKNAKNWTFNTGQYQIAPARGQGAAEIPQESLNFQNYQRALNGWIDKQTVLGKPPSGKQIREKAFELIPQYQMSIAEKMENLRAADKEYQNAINANKANNPQAAAPTPAFGSQKKVVKKFFSPSTGKTKIIYYDGTEEIR